MSSGADSQMVKLNAMGVPFGVVEIEASSAVLVMFSLTGEMLLSDVDGGFGSVLDRISHFESLGAMQATA